MRVGGSRWSAGGLAPAARLLGALGAAALGLAASPAAAREDTVPYAAARASGRPYECVTRAPSFFGESQVYRVRIRGDDFHAVEASGSALDTRPFAELDEPDRHHCVRLDGVAYSWRRASGPAMRFDPVRARAASSELYGKREPWKNLFFFVEPSEGDRCRPVDSVEIEVPADLAFEDFTERFLEADRNAVAARNARIDALPFRVYLPTEGTGSFSRVRAWLPDEEEGGGDDLEKEISFHYTQEDPGELRVLEIREHLVVPPDQAQAFLLARPAWRGCLSAEQRGCQVVAVTPRGRSILAPPPDPSGRHYSFIQGPALISFVHIRLGRDRQRSWYPDGDPSDRNYRFAPGELERFVDSFEVAEPTAVYAIEPYE